MTPPFVSSLKTSLARRMSKSLLRRVSPGTFCPNPMRYCRQDADKQSEMPRSTRKGDQGEGFPYGNQLHQLPQTLRHLGQIARRTSQGGRVEGQTASRGTHARPGGEQRIAQGLHSQRQQCPICGQGGDGLAPLSAYQKYFGATYAALRKNSPRFKRASIMPRRSSTAHNAKDVTETPR